MNKLQVLDFIQRNIDIFRKKDSKEYEICKTLLYVVQKEIYTNLVDKENCMTSEYIKLKELSESDVLIIEMEKLLKELRKGPGYIKAKEIYIKIDDLHTKMEKHAKTIGDLR